jgi:uncharacterized protein (TIGR02453 family)
MQYKEIQQITTFLTALEANNSKVFMDQNKDSYLKAKASFTAFVEDILEILKPKIPELGMIDPKKTLYRINRDIRFSKDKSPYKTWLACGICKQGKSSGFPILYFHLQKDSIMVGLGDFQPNTPQLTNLRHFALDNQSKVKQLLKIINSNQQTLSTKFGILKKVPRGFKDPLDKEIQNFIRLKSFIIADTLMLDQKNLPQVIAQFFINNYQLITFLNTAVNYTDWR